MRLKRQDTGEMVSGLKYDIEASFNRDFVQVNVNKILFGLLVSLRKARQTWS